MIIVAEDLRQLDKPVREDQWPHVACPVCRVGYLAVGDLTPVDSARSSRAYDETRLPSELRGTFHGVLRCIRHSCLETVAVAGDYSVDFDATDDGLTRDFNFYRLRFAIPALKIILPPPGTPEAVTTAIDSAALIIWADPSAAANRLRFAIDELLTACGMPRFRNANGKRRRLPTDERIKEFGRYESGADALEAVKWIGNQGSHEAGLSVTDVLDGADLLSHALKILYDRSEEAMERRIRAVNKRKGLPRTKTTP
jgi:Domain of unknown function (DUF4145)